MDATAEIAGDFVVGMASGDTIIRADILGIKSPDDHPLVFTNRQQLHIGPQIGTCRHETDDNHRTSQDLCSFYHANPPAAGNFQLPLIPLVVVLMNRCTIGF
jgi:hypothetical protein